MNEPVVPPEDPTLAKWQRGEQRRVLAIVALVMANLLQAIGIGVLLVRDINAQPALEEIRVSEQHDACERTLEAEFLHAIGAAIGVGSVEREEALKRIKRASDKMERMAGGEDPCVVAEVPNIHPHEE